MNHPGAQHLRTIQLDFGSFPLEKLFECTKATKRLPSVVHYMMAQIRQLSKFQPVSVLLLSDTRLLVFDGLNNGGFIIGYISESEVLKYWFNMQVISPFACCIGRPLTALRFCFLSHCTNRLIYFGSLMKTLVRIYT